MPNTPTKQDLLKETIEHVDITKLNATPLVEAYKKMSFSSRDLGRAADIFNMMLKDKDSSVWLTLAGSTSAAGCMQAYVDMVKLGMIDCIVSTGASIVDMDFFEALGYKHYKGSPFIDDGLLRSLYIDRIYDTFINEEELQECDKAIKAVADQLEPRPYSSREFIWEMGKWLTTNSKKKESLIQVAYEHNVPIFCPAFTDSSAGFGLVMHQVEHPDKHVTMTRSPTSANSPTSSSTARNPASSWSAAAYRRTSRKTRSSAPKCSVRTCRSTSTRSN